MRAPLLFCVGLFVLVFLLAEGLCPIIPGLVTATAIICLLVVFTPPGRKMDYLLIALLVLGLGFSFFHLTVMKAKGPLGYEHFWGKTITLKGRALSTGRNLTGYTKLILDPEYLVDGDSCISVNWGRIETICPGESLKVGAGDLILVKGELIPPEKPKNPAEYNNYLSMLSRGLVGRLHTEPEDIRVKDGEPGIMGILISLREKTSLLIKNTLNEPASGLLISLLLGQREELNRDLVQSFRELGLSHLLALSGLHIGFLVLLLSIVLQNIRLNNWIKTGLSVTIIISYVVMVGSSPSTVRAGIMASLLITSIYLFPVKQNYLNLLGLVFWIMVINNPYIVFSIGFQLSFSVTICIIYLMPVLEHHLSKYLHFKFLADYLALNLAAFLGALPLQMYHFYSISWGALICNLWAVPLVGVILILGLLALLLGLFHQIFAYLCLGLVRPFISVLIEGVNLFSLLTDFTLPAFKPSLWQVLIFYLGIILIVEGLKSLSVKLWRFPAYLILTGLVCIIVILIPLNTYRKPDITFLSVGQGDAVLVQGYKTRLLIDCGGDKTSGYRVILPYLMSRCIRRLDGILVTHFDLDHYRHLAYLISNLQVDCLFVPYNYNPPSSIKKLLREKGIPTVYLKAGMVIRDQWLELKVLNPGEQAYGVTNLDSVVLLGNMGDLKFLLTGDINREVLTRLMALLKERVRIIQAPHHGSDDSFSDLFYNQLKPEAVIISVGRNDYGHPGKSLLNYLKERGIGVFRTDKQGAITIRSNTLVTYKGKKMIFLKK